MKKALILAAVLFMAAGCSTKPSEEEKFLNHFKGYSTIEPAPGVSGNIFNISEGGKRLTDSTDATTVHTFVRAESENSAVYLWRSSGITLMEHDMVFTSATELIVGGSKTFLKK